MVRCVVRCDPKSHDFSGAGAVRCALLGGAGAVRGAGVNFGRTKYLEFLANMHEFGTITTYFWSYND